MKIKIKEIKANIASDYRYTTVIPSISFIYHAKNIYIQKLYKYDTRRQSKSKESQKGSSPFI